MTTKYDEKKLAELIVYLALKCEPDPGFGAVKLNKLLFFADFWAFKGTGKSITGAEYQKLKHGPAPRRLVPVRRDLEEGRALHIRNSKFGLHEQQRPVALRDPDLSSFSADEIALVDEVVRLFWGKNAKDVSDTSHELVGWQVAAEGETIPYESEIVAEESSALDDAQRARYGELRAAVLSEARS